MGSVIFAILTLLLWPMTAQAGDICAASHIKNIRLVGQGKMKVAFWHIYDAALYGLDGKYSPDRPYALKLVYRQDIKGKKISETSRQEMRKNGFTDEKRLAEWSARMEKIFPDVRSGDSLTGVYTGEKTIFCHGDRKIGAIPGSDFARHFFGIWLSEKTSAPALRRKLLGAS